MVFHCFDHDLVLEFGAGNFHSASSADRWVGNISISGNFVGGVDDYHPFFQVIGEHAGNFAQGRGFADSGATEHQN